MKELTIEDIQEFKQLKEWCAKCPAEAAERIKKLETSRMEIATDLGKTWKQNQRYKQYLRNIRDISTGSPHIFAVEALKGESE